MSDEPYSGAFDGPTDDVIEGEWDEFGESFDSEEAAAPPHVEPPEPLSFRGWLATAMRGLIDLQFRQASTRVLLPVIYVLGLLLALALPIALTVVIFRFSSLLGVLFLIFVAPLVGLSIAATVRLVLEFLININRLVRKVDHMTLLADDLHLAIADMAEPVSQLSQEVRAVQFWRRKRR